MMVMMMKKVVIYAKGRNPRTPPFFANYQKLLHRVGCRSLLQVTMGGLALTLAITSAKVSTRGKFCLFSWKGHWAPRVLYSRTSTNCHICIISHIGQYCSNMQKSGISVGLLHCDDTCTQEAQCTVHSKH